MGWFHSHKWEVIFKAEVSVTMTSIFRGDWREPRILVLEQCKGCEAKRAYVKGPRGNVTTIDVDYAESVIDKRPRE